MAILVDGRRGGRIAEAITGYDDPRFTSGFTCKRTRIVETAFATSLGPSKLVTKCRSNIGNSLLRKLVAAVRAQ